MTQLIRNLCLGAVVVGWSACNCGGPPADITGTWTYRYSCGNATQCFDADVCDTVSLVADPSTANGFKSSSGSLHGTLNGTTFRWTARWGDPPYDEVGVWTFSSDFTSFTQSTCYTYDGTVDEATTTCTGQNRGECSGAGAKSGPPAPPAAVGACDAGTGNRACG